MKILAVDDDPHVRELIPLIAAKSGFPDVTAVSSAGAVLDRLVKGDVIFDCLLLDISMPEMDGIELCGRVRQLEAYRKTPIIMLTAMSEREYMDNAFKAGATDYSTKPFDIKELGARLRVAQELVQARREAHDAKLANPSGGSAISQRHAFGLGEAILVGGSEKHIDFVSMNNYIRQLSRAGSAASQVIAIKVDRIEDIYEVANTGEYSYALEEIAYAVNEVLQTRCGLISYAGNGMFVVVSNSPTPLHSGDIETDVQHLLDEKNAEYDSSDPMDIEVSIGNPFQLRFSDVGEASKTLERAIARAEARSKSKPDVPPVMNRRQFGRLSGKPTFPK